MTDRDKLSPAALAFRRSHAAVAAAFLIAIGYVRCCALTARRGRLLRVAVTPLIGQGIAR